MSNSIIDEKAVMRIGVGRVFYKQKSGTISEISAKSYVAARFLGAAWSHISDGLRDAFVETMKNEKPQNE